MIQLGTCGYSYPEWKTVFYPEDIKPSSFLSYYSTQFSTVEIDSTYYRIPTEQQMKAMVDKAPKLSFSVKAPSLLTHNIDNNWPKYGDSFISAVSAMGDNLKAVLFQFPQSFHYTVANRRYLGSVLSMFQSFPKVVEFRQKEWYKTSVFNGLEKFDTALGLAYQPKLPDLPPLEPIVTTNFSYLRFHSNDKSAWYEEGRKRYDYLFSEEELSSTVPLINTISKKALNLYIYFNNHPGGKATQNVHMLEKLLGLK